MTSSHETRKAISIAYTQETRDVLEELYATFHEVESSTALRDVSRRAIQQVPTSYTAWQRYLTGLRGAGGSDTDGETLIGGILEETPKNYQLWNFRRQVYLDGRTTAEEELGHADIALQQDSKNYHAWSHRQAVLNHVEEAKRTELIEQEIDYVDNMLEEDVFNNSAWNQKYYLLQYLPTPARHLAEYEKTKVLLRKAPHSEAGWNFCQSIVRNTSVGEKMTDVVKFCHEILREQPVCLPCLEFLADAYFAIASSQVNVTAGICRQCLASCTKILRQCATIDPIRSNYWSSRLRHIEHSCD